MTEKNTPDTFDARLARLQEIVTRLEAGTLPLEEGLALYKEGVGLSTACREQLERAKNEIKQWTESGPQPFEVEGEAGNDGAGHG